MKMSSKLLKLLVLLVIISVIVFYYFILKQKNEKKIVENITSNSYSEYNIFNNSKTTVSDQRYIYDLNHPDVVQAKSFILSNTRLSEKYFDQHFKFDHLVNEKYAHSVRYFFSIGDYSTMVEVNMPNTNGGSMYTLISGMSEISNVLSKQAAEYALIECLGSNPFKKQQAILDLNSDGLFLGVTDIDAKFSASLNLETGVCIKTPAVLYER